MQPSEFTKQKIKSLWLQWKKSGGTQVTLAAASGATQGNISLWINGRLPNVDGLVALSKGFNVPITAFFPPTEDEHRESPEIAPALLADLADALADPELGPGLEERIRNHARAVREKSRSDRRKA